MLGLDDASRLTDVKRQSCLIVTCAALMKCAELSTPTTRGKALASSKEAPPTAQPRSKAATSPSSPVKSCSARQLRSHSKASRPKNCRASWLAMHITVVTNEPASANSNQGMLAAFRPCSTSCTHKREQDATRQACGNRTNAINALTRTSCARFAENSMVMLLCNFWKHQAAACTAHGFTLGACGYGRISCSLP